MSDAKLYQNVSGTRPKVLRAVLYARVSSQEQARKQFSIPEIQIPQSKELIKESGWRFVKCYVDEACDGNTFLKRPELQKMLIEDINTYDIVVVWSFDRLMRDDQDVEAKIYKILDRNQKQVTSVLQRTEIVTPEQYDPKSLNVATQRRFRSMQVAYDSLTRRERFMASKEKLVAKGKHIVEASYGYEILRKIDPQNSRRTIGYRRPSKEEAPILRRIFKERVMEGKSYREIAFGLNRDEIKARKGDWWSGPRISQVCRNPFPCGYISWHKTEDRKYGDETVRKVIPEENWKFFSVDRKLEKYYRPIISESLFWKAQEIRKKFQTRGRSTDSSNVLSKIIKCSKCGSPMVETGIYKIKKPPYKKGFYQCSMWANKHRCSPKRYPSWPIKMSVLEKVKAFINDPQAYKEFLREKSGYKIQDKERELKISERQLGKIREDIKSLNLKYLRGNIKEKYYPSLLQDLETREGQLEEKCLSLKEDMRASCRKSVERKSLETLGKEIKEGFESLTNNQIKLIIRILAEEIIPGKKIKGRGVRGDPRIINPIIKWKSPAIIEQGCMWLF